MKRLVVVFLKLPVLCRTIVPMGIMHVLAEFVTNAIRSFDAYEFLPFLVLRRLVLALSTGPRVPGPSSP